MYASASCHFVERADGCPLVYRQAQAAFNLGTQKQPLAITDRHCSRNSPI